MTEKPENALQAMTVCNKEIYPSVLKLFQILATLPVSTASNERTFSNLKRIKTYLRNTMTEVRINYYVKFKKKLFVKLINTNIIFS